jgi:hypothetical protein
MLRRTLATNVRRIARERFVNIDPRRLAGLVGWHPSHLYAVLAVRRAPCLDRIAGLAAGLAAPAAALLRTCDDSRSRLIDRRDDVFADSGRPSSADHA